ncbi:30464_t:CDS:1, partial [Gigaspora margarita]
FLKKAKQYLVCVDYSKFEVIENKAIWINYDILVALKEIKSDILETEKIIKRVFLIIILNESVEMHLN